MTERIFAKRDTQYKRAVIKVLTGTQNDFFQEISIDELEKQVASIMGKNVSTASVRPVIGNLLRERYISLVPTRTEQLTPGPGSDSNIPPSKKQSLRRQDTLATTAQQRKNLDAIVAAWDLRAQRAKSLPIRSL